MRNDPIKVKVLSVKLIPNLDESLGQRLELPKGHRSIGLITTDCDDVGYTAIDLSLIHI